MAADAASSDWPMIHSSCCGIRSVAAKQSVTTCQGVAQIRPVRTSDQTKLGVSVEWYQYRHQPQRVGGSFTGVSSEVSASRTLDTYSADQVWAYSKILLVAVSPVLVHPIPNRPRGLVGFQEINVKNLDLAGAEAQWRRLRGSPHQIPGIERLAVIVQEPQLAPPVHPEVQVGRRRDVVVE